jgi:PAS domain S-box-containing protein
MTVPNKPLQAFSGITPTAEPDPYLALSENQFVPYFQPLVTLRTGKLAGFEALARWEHPAIGLILPSNFISVAERDGWIEELTYQVLQKALAAASAIPDPLSLAFNISPVQLRDRSLPERIRRIAKATLFPLSRLVLEITESALVDDLDSAIAIVSELKAMGCKLALDDFGTGYSSLHHLQSLPFDKLKVDRSFISSMVEQRDSRKIVAAVVGLGQSLGLTTVAEGIETQEQAEMMLWLGCDFGQGYFYGRPIPAEELPLSVSTRREETVTRNMSAWKRISATNLDVSPSQRLAQLQALYDGAPVGLAFVDQQLRYVNLNRKLADMNGSGIEDHLGSDIAGIVPEFFPQIEPYLRRALVGEATSEIEITASTTGETRLVSYQPARDEAGEIVGVAIAVMDITERKRVEDALKSSEAHYRSMVDLNPQVLWIMDPQGRNLDASPRWDKLTGLMKLHSTDHEWLKCVHPEDLQTTVGRIAEFRRTGSPIDVEYRVKENETRYQWKRSRGSPRFDANGNIVCWYGSVQDIEAPSESREKTLTRSANAVNVTTSVYATISTANALDEAKRRQALLDLEILDTPAESAFDDLVALASEICATPISLVSLVDSKRQWFKASIGLAVFETPISSSFCAHAIQQQGIFIVEDTLKDDRFRENPLVLGNPHIRSYAGVPIYAKDGIAIGTLCVIDTVPRSLTPAQIKALTILSHQVQAQLELRSGQRKIQSMSSTITELTTGLEVMRSIEGARTAEAAA